MAENGKIRFSHFVRVSMNRIKMALCMAVCVAMTCCTAAFSGCAESEPDSPQKKDSSSKEADSSEEASSGDEPAVQMLTNDDDESVADEEADEGSEASSESEVTTAVTEKKVETRTPEAAVLDSWYSVTATDFSQVYSNSEFNEKLKELQDICTNASYNLGFAYKNLSTGATVTYNASTRFLTCSTIKAPYVKYVLSQDVNLDEVIVKDANWSGDDGTVASSPNGMKYTVRQLIEYAICESDNTAYYLLVKRFGYWGFNSMLSNLGANYKLGDSWIFTYCTANDMLKCYEDIYNFGEEEDYGTLLIGLMKQATLNIQIGAALGDKYEVAQKYGSEFSEITFNDCAIVYADSPYVLCIFTNQYPETDKSCQVFKDIALAIDDINSLIVDETAETVP
jgi:hypothetical protein